MSYYIIGTAGHVDHGKTQLIKALTGEDTDRLKEEKERGISIELGFAALTLPSGATAGVVDVPGHEKFVRQMLAGIGGIDLVLLVIAADEGVMPQTREHLEIIDLLQIRKGLVVLSKIDLVEQDWCDLVKLEIEETLQHTVLAGADIVEVSAVTGQGVSRLVELIDQELAQLTPRESTGPCRMPVDRVFSLPGFGTIVTGTVYHGSIKVGGPVAVEPGGLASRVRSLQVHGSKMESASAGMRVAANLPDLEVADIPRGATVLSPGYLTPVKTLDLSFRYLPSAAAPLQQRQRVRFHIGTKEVLGRVQLLDREELEPGNTAFMQILLEEPVIAVRGDKFVIRRYSPTQTIGGGTVLDTGQRKYKRFDPEVVRQLAVKEKGAAEDLVYAVFQAAAQPLEVPEIARLSGLTKDDVEDCLPLLGDKVDHTGTEDQDYWFSLARADNWTKGVKDTLAAFQAKYPLRQGFPKEEFKSRFFPGWSAKHFSAYLNYLQKVESLTVSGNFVSLPGYQPGPHGQLQHITDAVLLDYAKAGLAPPEWGTVLQVNHLDAATGEELLQFLLRQGSLIKVAPNLFFEANAVKEASETVLSLLAAQGGFSAAEAKDRLNTSRKYLIPLLEYFDSQKLTRRLNDKRVKF